MRPGGAATSRGPLGFPSTTFSLFFYWFVLFLLAWQGQDTIFSCQLRNLGKGHCVVKENLSAERFKEGRHGSRVVFQVSKRGRLKIFISAVVVNILLNIMLNLAQLRDASRASSRRSIFRATLRETNRGKILNLRVGAMAISLRGARAHECICRNFIRHCHYRLTYICNDRRRSNTSRYRWLFRLAVFLPWVVPSNLAPSFPGGGTGMGHSLSIYGRGGSFWRLGTEGVSPGRRGASFCAFFGGGLVPRPTAIPIVLFSVVPRPMAFHGLVIDFSIGSCPLCPFLLGFTALGRYVVGGLVCGTSAWAR